MSKLAFGRFVSLALLAKIIVAPILSVPSSFGAEIKSPSTSIMTSSGEDPNCQTNQFDCTPLDANKVSGCGALNTQSSSELDASQVGNCLDSVSQSLSGPLAANKRAVLNLSSTRVRAFLGYVLTCYGEASNEGTPADMMAIMLTIANRTNQCKRDIPPPRLLTPMHIALQDKQFSMYNPDIYAATKGKGAFEARASDPKMKKCIEAFVKFSKTKTDDFQPQPRASQVMYYYAPAGMKNAAKKPKWSDIGKEVDLTINGEKITSGVHKFQDNHWSCKAYADDDGTGGESWQTK